MEHTAGIVDATASRHGNAISDPPSTTTISTVAVQAGKAKIVLAILRSNEWIRVRIQQMEPDLMEVGSTLEEAKALRREHDELLMKLNLKQKDVTELLARADDLASQNKSYQEVYTAMAHSLGEAWKDLNTQLEYRKMLLDQSIAFHQSALQFSHRMEEAQCRFDQTGLAQDVETARRQLQQHTDIKKSILESSMSTLQEGQSLLDRIREMGMRADVQNRHATTAACYGIEHLLELLQDRRRRLEELWVQRRVKLEQCLQLLLLDTEVNKISEWFTSSGDVYLSKKDLGDSAAAAHQLTEEHYRFEAQAKEIHENVLRLVRTADQLVHSDLKNAEGVRQRLKTIDDKCEQFMHKMDYRRKNVTMATQFFTLAQAALMKLNNIEVDLSRTDLPRNSAALAEKHAQFSTAIVEHSTPALREGRILLERVGRNDPSSQGVLKMVTDLQEKCTKLEEMCKARYEAGEKSQAFNQFQEKYTTLSSWLVQIGQATLRNRGDLGIDVYTAKDFVELHERLAKDLTDKVNEVRGLSEAAEALATSGDAEGGAAKERALALHQQWELVQTTVAIRIKLALSYVHFHKKAQSLAIKMDALEQYLKIEKMDAAAITEAAIKHKEQKWTDVSHNYKDVENQGKDFIKKAADVKKDEELDTRRAVAVVESILQMFIERMGTVTDYYEHWKVHVSTGKEFKTQWAQFVAEARKTIDWVMRIEDDFFPLIAGELGNSIQNTQHFQKKLEEFGPTMKTIDWVRKSEKDFFVPFIAGKLGKTAEEVKKSLSKMEAFMPTVKKAQADIEEHLKTAEMLSLKGDTHGQKDQIINELLKVHTRFQARINEYQVLLNMTVKFFTNLNQLDKLIEKTEKEFSTADLPKEVDKARLMLREHESNRERMSELINFTTEEGEQIVIRVRQQDSEALAKDEVQKVLQMTEERRHAWEQRWEDHRNRLEQNLQVAQFYFDLRQIHQELDELNRQLDARHGNYGSSLSSVKMTSDAFKQFEASAKVIEDKVNTFVATAGHMIRQEHYDSRRIRVEVDQVQKKWHEFVGRVSEYRTHLDESTKFFELLEEADNFFHDASQFLLQVGRKATSCKTSAEADDLIKDLDKYRTEGAAKQDDKLGQMYRYIVNLYGQVQGPPKMQPTVEKNQEILDSFLKAMKELGILRDNLLKKEQILAEMDAVVESKAPRVPVFSQPLQNTEIKEGQKFTFHCRLECDGEPKIEWFKDDLPITSPDYQQTYKDGMASLTIEETFSEDTAKYMCKATTPFGQAETTAYLKVKETHRKIIAPDFIKHIKSSEIPEGTQFMFECAVSGTPSPTISWFKDDVNIDNSPEYIITKINGTCCLKIRKAQKEQTGRYTCKAANQGGEAATSAKLNVLGVKKPHFHEPLKNVTCAEGKSVRLECKFTGEPTPTIHWMRNDVGIMPSGVFKVIVEANYTALEITEVYPEDAGTFSVLAKNIGGETRTSCVLVVEGMFSTTTEPEEVVEPQAPKFVQPLKNKDVMEGSRARLDCVITGQPEPEVIWYHNEKPVKESKDFQLLFEGDRCSLIIREVYLEDSGDYKCVARNPHGMADSKCRLIVEPLSELSDASATSAPADVVPPKFTQLLKDLEGVEGRQVRFDCRVIGHPTPEIKWFREHTEIKNSADFQISMHRELHSLTIPEVFKEDSGNFMCRAVNMAGEAKCYASLVVKPAMDAHVVKTRLIEEAHTVVKVPTAVGITHQGPDFKTVFSDLRVKAGEPCKFDVTIHGNPRPRVRWLFNNEPIVSPDYQISCFGDVYSLYIPEVFDEDAGRFSIIAENDSGKATCSALLEVVDESAAPPLMPAPPGARERTPYSPAPKAKKEEPIQVKVAAAPVAMAAPAAPPPPPQSYSTEMVVPNKQAFKPVDIVVEVPVPPRFVEPLKNISVEEGTRVTLEGMVDGKPEPTVKWYKAGKEISNTPDFQVSFRNKRVTLTIPEVFPEDAGPYECIARNEAGISRSTADIVVKASATAPEFLDRLTTREVKEGESVRFTIRVMGKPAPEVTWYREGSQIISSPDFEIIKDGETSSLYIPEVFYEDSGKFSVKAENPGGVNTCTAELIVEAPSAMEESASPSPPVSRSPSVGHSPERGQYRPGIPKPGSSREPTPLKDQRPVQFSKPLQDTTVREGQRAVLECIINPYPEPQRVQWFRNEIEIFTSPDYQISYSHGICTLIISEVFPEDAGKFSCTITINNIPSTTHMYLTVDPGVPQQPLMAPLFEIKITNQPLNYGQTAYFECKVQGYPPPEILWTRRGHPLVDKTRYKSTYDQYSGITTLTILNLRDEDEGEYTCTALNTEGECSTSAMLLAPAHYQDWLRQEQGLPPAPTPAKSPRVVSELPEKRLEPTPMQMAPPPAPQYSEPDGFKVSHFEKVLEQEVAYRDGRVDPHGMQLPSDAEEAFDANAVEACPPRIEQRLSNFKLMEGSDATFVCLVSGHPRPTVQWFHNGRNLKPGNRYEMRYTREGYCTLRIRVAFPEDEGYYTVCATNVMGRDMCSAELYIEELSRVDDTSYVAPEALRKMTRAPGQRRGSEEGGVAERYFKPVFRKIPADEEVQEGALCRFDCLVSGRPMPEIYWYRDNEQVLDTSEHKIVVKEDGVHSLIIEHVAPHDAGLYTCIAQNRGGEDRFQVRLNVKARQEAYVPQFTERLKNVTCTEGDNITLFAEAHGVPPPMLSWSKDGRILDRDDNYKITTQGGSSWLQIPCVRKLDSTWFQCNAVNIAGSAANRVKIMVQPAPRKVEPPKKLVITRRGMTPTKRYRSQSPTTPKAPAAPFQPITPSAVSMVNIPMNVRDFRARPAPPQQRPRSVSPMVIDLARPAMAPVQHTPSTPSTAEIMLMQPPLVRPEPVRPVQSVPQPPAQAPRDVDMYDPNNPQAPQFRTKPQSLENIQQGQPAQFDCRLAPIGDPSMKVEWFKDGKILRTGHRFKPVYDFGHCSLEILYAYPEDSGTYMVVAMNECGKAEEEVELDCFGDPSVDEETQLPEGMQSMPQIQSLEHAARKPMRKQLSSRPNDAPPVFDLMPEPVKCEEGDCAKFRVKISGFPRPRLTWWVNGAMVMNAPRFKLRYDGMMHYLEIPKCREYDAGVVRVVAKNPLGEAECTTQLTVIPQDDWRSRLKQAPKSTAEIELQSRKVPQLYTLELQQALSKPKTTVVELRQFERSTHEKAMTRDQEILVASQQINLQHSKMTHDLQVRVPSDPHAPIDNAVHIERARYMLGMLQDTSQQPGNVPRTRLERKEPPSFTMPLKAITVPEGHGAKLEVGFVGHPSPRITWLRDGQEIMSCQDFQINTSPNKSFLWISQVYPEDTGLYQVRAENPFGMAECKGSLTVQGETVKQTESPPEFFVQMRDLEIRVGDPATFDCQISGYPRPDFYWTKNGQRLSESTRWKFIVEEDHYTLLIYEVHHEDQGRYECIAQNALGKATCTANLQVDGQMTVELRATAPVDTAGQAPTLLEPMRDQKVDEGSQAHFRCRMVGSPEPVVQWYYNNQVIKPSKYFQMYSSNGTYTLTLAGAFPEDEGIYKCTARNQAGEVTCIAHLKVNSLSGAETQVERGAPPSFSKPISGQQVKPGQDARFEVTVAGQPGKVTWFCEGRQVTQDNRHQIFQQGQTFVLLVKNCTPQDVGAYTCRISNPAGVAECSAPLYIDGVQAKAPPPAQKQPPRAPQILKAPSPVREVAVGNTTKLVVQLAAYPPPRYAWYFNNQQIQQSQRVKQSYDNGSVTLIIYNVQAQDSGDYVLKAKNDLGECTWKTTLHIHPSEKIVQLPGQKVSVGAPEEVAKDMAPTFTQPLPPETTVNESSTARLEAHVKGKPMPKVQWLVNGLEIKPSPKYSITWEGDRSVLLIKNITKDDTAIYAIRAVNDLGEAVSSTTLYVIPAEKRLAEADPPRFILPLQSCEAFDGEEVILTCNVVGRPKPEVSWFHNDKCIDVSEDFVLNYNRETGKCDCVIVECLPDDQGVFRCVARNDAGQAKTECKLTWKAAPPKPTKEEAVKPDATAVVQAKVQAAPLEEKKVKVVKREEFTVDGENRLDTETVTTTETKTVKKLVKKDSGQAPRFTRPIQPQVVREGETATFNAITSGAPQPEVMWLKDKKEMKPNDRIKMHYNKDTSLCELVIQKANQSDVGVYSCRASNTAGKATCTANVVVVPPDAEVTVTEKTMSVKKEKVTIVGDEETRVTETSPNYTQQLPSALDAAIGSNVRLECRIEGLPEPQISWTFNGQIIQPSKRREMTCTNHVCTLVITQVGRMDSGDYVCRAVNSLGEATTKCTLRVGAPAQNGIPQPVPQPGTGSSHPVGAPIVPQMTPSVQSRPGDLAPEVPPAPLTEPCAVIPGQVPHMPVGAEMTATINLSGGADISTRYQQQSVNIQQTSSMIGQPRATFQQQTSYTGAHMSRSTARPITLQGPRPASLDSIRPSTLEGKVQAAYSANLNRPHSLEGRVQAAYKLKQDAPPQPTTLEGRVQTAYRMNSTGMSPVEPEMSSTYQTSVFQSSTAYSSMSGVQQQEQFQQQVSTGLTRSISTSSTSYQRREVSSGRSTPIRISSRQTTPVRSGRTTPVRSGRSTPTMQEPPRFTQPLRDITINDGDKVVFRVMWRGIPRPTINWYFNSEPIIPSDDFLIKIDIQRGESTLTIKEVFPDDEGEYMCKAESTLGAAVTHCHLFVRLPSSSEEDIQEVVSRSKDVLRVQESLHLKERSSFSETISIETQKRFKEFQMQFQIPDRKAERTEILMRQQAALRGMRMDVNVDLPVPKTEVQTKTMHLQKTIDVKPSMQKHLAYLNLPLEQQRRFSETIAIDQSRPRPDPVQVTFSLPEQRRRLEKSAIQIRQQAALRGMKMEVEIAESRRQTTKCEFQTKKRAEAVSTKRQEFHMQLEGAPPHFTIDLTSAKVMDGEEVKFNACVTGNPMPEVTWYKNGKVIVENPDFRTTYSKKTGVCTLHILEVFPQDTGEYRCIAVNQYGRAVTGATLQVDVFEYVPDSEEASASAAESLPDRIVSEDEAEFLERTQAFIANMQKLRQELQEEQVREEEVIMTEEYNEETVQMADVKWQIPKKAVTMEIEIPEQVASEMQSHVMEEVTQEKRVTVEMVQPIVQVKKEQMATQQLAPLVAEEITEVVQEERTETTQEQRIDVALATHRVEAQPTMQARHIVSIVKPETVAEHPSAPSPEAPLQEEIKVELQQPVKKPVQEARVQPQMEHLAEEHTAEFTAEVTTDLVDGQQVQVELAQIDQVKRRESMAMPIEEHLQPEIIQEILERVPSPEESQQQQVQVEMMSHQVDTAKESLAIQQVKVVKTEEVVESLERVPTPMQSEQLHVEQIALVQHIREQPKESMALPMEEVTQAEVVFESAERVPSPEESQQQHVTVELSQHVVEGAVGALVHPTEEVTQAEMVGEAARVPSPEASQEEHVVVELSSHMVEQATTSLVQPLEEMLHPEIVMESLDRVPTPEGAGEERVQVMLSTTQTEEAKQSLVQPVQEMLSPEMVEESLDRVPSPEGAGEERVEVMLSTTETVQAKQSLVQPIQEVVTPEMLEECKDRIPTPEGAGEEQVQVLLEMHQKEAAMGAMVMPVEEVTMVEVTDESRERIPTPEGAGEQQVQVQLAMQQTELAKGSMVMPIEEVTMVEVTDESRERIPTPEGAGEQHVQVQLEMQQTELAKGSMVMPVEEVTMVEVTDESKERIPTPEGAGEQHVQVQLEIQQTELAKGSMVMPVEEVTQVEVTDESREYIPTPEGAGEQQVQVQLEIQQTEEAKGALVMPVEEITQVEVTDESKERIPTPEGAGEQHVQVQLEIQQTEEARGAMVMPVEEVTQVEVTDESKERIPTPEGAGEEHVYVDLDRGWIMDAEGAMVMPQTELLPPEEAQESLDRVPTPEGAGEEKVIVDLGQSTVEAAKGALVMPLMEILPPEVVEESRERVPTPEGAGEEHVKVPLGQHAVEAAKGAMVQPQEERMKEEDIMDILDRMPSPVETQEQRVVVPLDQPDVAGAKEHYTGFVEERHSEEEEEDIFFEAAEPAPEGKEVKVDLGYVYVQDREMLLTETQHAQIEAIEAGEANAEYTEEDTYKEQVQVALEEAQKQPAKPSLVDMQEQVISPLQAEDLNVEEVWEETSQEKRVEVPLGMAEKEAAKGSLVGHTDEVVEVQMTREDIEELREETSRGGKVHVQMDSAWKAHRPLQLAGPVAEQVQPELIASQYDDSIKEMRMIPTYVQPEYEPAVLEWFRLEIRVHPRGLEIMEEEVAAETRIEQSEMSLHEMQLQLERDQQILQESCQMSATQFQTETQRIQWRAEAAAESHLAFQTQEVRAQTEAQMRMMSAQMESQVIRAAQEITEEREVVTETTREEIEVIKRPVIEETVQQEVQERVRTEIKRELMAPAFEIPLSDITVTDGERATFECKVTGFPRPQVTWYVDSQEIKITTEFRMEYTIEGYVILIISDVLAEDEGEYMVKAVNEAGTCTTTAYLTVLPPERSEPASPMVETQMMMQKRMEDENIMDEWMEEWTEERKIQWTEQKMMQQRMVEEQMRQQQMTQQHMAQQQVVLQKPQDETWHDESWSDERVVEESYRQMQLDISMQSQKQTAVVEVPIPTQPEAPSFVKMLEHKEVFETMDITFECHVTGNPEPKIIWRKDGKKIEMSQRIEIFYYRGVATLTIRRVTIEDEGEYTCEVYNEWGVCSSSAELLVEKLLHTIEQVILEELYEIEIEMLFKWRATAMEAFTIEHFSGSEIIRA